MRNKKKIYVLKWCPKIFVFLIFRMEKPWRSPPPSGGQPSSTTKTLPMQMSSSTPLHFSPGVALSPANLSAATTRMSLDLFHKNAFKYQMEQPSRPSLTTGWFLLIFWKKENNNTPSTKSLFVSRLCSVSFEEQFFHVIVVASLSSGRCWNAVIWYAAVCRPSDAGRNSSTQVGTAFQQPHSHQVKVSRLSFIMSILSPKSRHKIEPSIKKCKRNRSPNRICFWAILHSIFTR